MLWRLNWTTCDRHCGPQSSLLSELPSFSSLAPPSVLLRAAVFASPPSMLLHTPVSPAGLLAAFQPPTFPSETVDRNLCFFGCKASRPRPPAATCFASQSAAIACDIPIGNLHRCSWVPHALDAPSSSL